MKQGEVGNGFVAFGTRFEAGSFAMLIAIWAQSRQITTPGSVTMILFSKRLMPQKLHIFRRHRAVSKGEQLIASKSTGF
ncbi:MAG: hypothetical protein N2444_07015 [Methylocystis sp.]|nr:hypothetical protein [Methylocystis sp.]